MSDLIYHFNDAEIEFLRLFCEIPILPGFPDITDVGGIRDPGDAIASLTDRQLLSRDDTGGFFLPEELTFLLAVARDAAAAVTITGKDRSMAAYFCHDAIVMITKEQDCELMWVPFLPMLIGAVANFLQPCRNEQTVEVKEHPAQQAEELRRETQDSGFEKTFDVSFFQDAVKREDAWIELYDDGRRQIELCLSGDRLTSSAPVELDLVNSITVFLAQMHRNAILRGEET